MGGADYAFKKLKRWKAEGPTERNRKTVQFVINHGSLSSQQSLLLIDLALEWGDFTMWQEVLDKDLIKLSLNTLIRAWGIFTFDRTKNMLVQSTPTPKPYFRCSRLHLMHLAELRGLFANKIPQRPRST